MTNPATHDAPQIVKHWTESEPVRLAAHRAGRVYLAGPMTGLPEFNFPAFNAEAASLRADGLVVINPAEHGIVEGAEWADYLRHDLAGLMSCERIHLLRGWHDSKGARLEVHAAKALGMQITYQDGATLAKCDGNHGGPRCADPECWNDSPPASDPLKDNQIAALINKVCRLASEFHNHDSLRQRIAQELVPALKQASGQPAAVGVSDDQLQAIDDEHKWQTLAGRMAAYRAILALRPAAQTEREAFEALIRRNCGDLRTFGYGENMHYRNSAVNNAWYGWKARASLPATQQATPEPVGGPLFWYRPRSDGGYEGPLHDSSIEDVRKRSGAWMPLFSRPAPGVPEGFALVPVEPTPEMMEAMPSLPAIGATGDMELKDKGWSLKAIQNRHRWLAALAAAQAKGGEHG